MKRGALAIIAVVVVALGLIASSAAFVVHQTKQALVLQFGEPVSVITEPGLHWKIPFIQNVVYIEKRILAFDAPAEEVIASDQKRLVVDSFLRFNITDPLKFFQSVGNENVARSRLEAFLDASLRRVLGNVAFSTVFTGERQDLMRLITKTVNTEAKSLGITVVDVRIKRADLPEANSQAIFRRMQTEREREAKEYRAKGAEESLRTRARADRERTVLLAEAERTSEILRGEGDAKAVRIFAQAYGRDVEFFAFYRSMLAYRKALGSEGTAMVLSPDSEFFRYFGSMSGERGGRK